MTTAKKTWQKLAISLMLMVAATGVVTYTDLFGILFQLKGVSHTHSGDITCAENCSSYVNITTDYWRICFEHPPKTQQIYLPGAPLARSTIGESPDTILYKKAVYGRTLWVNLNNVKNIITTSPEVPVDWLVPTYGKKWRPLKDGDCWERGKVNRIHLVGHKKPTQTVKWSFELGEGDTSYVEIDPYWNGIDTPIGYEFLDNNTVLHTWNSIDDYYFNASSSMQWSNHYQKWWSHNLFCLGYYQGGSWHKIKCVDELSGFNKQITTDNQTYLNITLWKDLTYQGYDFRMGLRYFLIEVNTTNCSVDGYHSLGVQPYIKAFENIPFNVGFAWKLNDIKVSNDYANDRLYINGTNYFLNNTLDVTYTNMSEAKYVIQDRGSLRLKWNPNLTYLVQVKSNSEPNAPITLGIQAGSLVTGQEKSTVLYWADPGGSCDGSISSPPCGDFNGEEACCVMWSARCKWLGGTSCLYIYPGYPSCSDISTEACCILASPCSWSGAGAADGEACDTDDDCTNSNCVEAINEAVDYCAPADKECSRSGYATGYDTGDVYDPGATAYICKGDDLGGAGCASPTGQCDEYASKYCNGVGVWTAGDSGGVDAACAVCKVCGAGTGDLSCSANVSVETADLDECTGSTGCEGTNCLCDGAGSCSNYVPDLNISYWNGAAWAEYTTSTWIEFVCGQTESDCEPTNQDAGTSQCIYRACNNGTYAGDVDMKLNATISCDAGTFTIEADDDYTADGATTLNTTYQQIHASLAKNTCQQICIWADTSGVSPPCNTYEPLWQIT